MYRELRPHLALRAHVDRFWIRAPGPGAEPRRILPDGCIDLLMGASGAVWVVGAMTRALVVGESSAAVAAVRFRPGGAAPFLRTEASALTDRRVAAEELSLSWLRPPPFHDDPTLGVKTLEEILLRRLADVAAPEPLVAHAVRALFAEAPPAVAALARTLGWTRQHLRRVFTAHVGVGPKELARVARLQRAVDRLQRGRGSVAEAAVTLGYFDQAHMAHDFRALAGVTPLLARSQPGSIFPITSLFDRA
jgi:AraC-like DNA-binding protein